MRRRVLRALCVLAALAAALSSPAFAQAPPGTTGGLPDRFQIDTGAFFIDAETVLRYQGQDVDFERDLDLDGNAGTFWLDGTWRVARRHQLKLNYTRLSREGQGVTLERGFTWGGVV